MDKDEEIKKAIKTALSDGGIETAKETCHEQEEGCKECRFRQNKKDHLCIFNICPLEWGDANG